MSVYMIAALAALIFGFMGVLLFNKVRCLQVISEAKQQKKSMMNAAKKHAISRVNMEKVRAERSLILQKDDLESEIEDRKAAAENSQQDFQLQEKYEKEHQQRINKLVQKNNTLEAKSQTAINRSIAAKDSYKEVSSQYTKKLAELSKLEVDNVKENLTQKIIEDRSHAIVKTNKRRNDELEKNSKKIAKRFISRTLARYKPNFYWPKAINQVPIANRDFYDRLFENPALEKIRIK